MNMIKGQLRLLYFLQASYHYSTHTIQLNLITQVKTFKILALLTHQNVYIAVLCKESE